MGSVDPEFKNQVHDFSPPIPASGLFWTVPVPDEAVSVDLGRGTAELHVRELAVQDVYNIPNALGGGPSEPATVTFDVYWFNPTAVENIVNTEQGFAGTFLDVTSALEFSAQTADFAYASDPATASTSLFGRIGYEANGVFLPAMGGTPTP
ncbi:MAG: hypothetical protein ACRDJC_19405 [Thermomicrobiales bacterium]